MTAEERRQTIEFLRDHFSDVLVNPSDDEVIDLALQRAAREYEGKPKPRSPRKKWEA